MYVSVSFQLHTEIRISSYTQTLNQIQINIFQNIMVSTHNLYLFEIVLEYGAHMYKYICIFKNQRDLFVGLYILYIGILNINMIYIYFPHEE